MRCPSCGTENAPDSRFCGGCGARLDESRPRIAPTQKIDDASFPQSPKAPAPAIARPHPASAPFVPTGMPAAMGPMPPVAVPEPPPAARPVSGPLGFQAPAAAAIDSPSRSLPIAARRPWRLITLVLIIDLGLAVAGVWLLAQGLGSSPAQGRATPRTPASASP